MSPQTVIFAGGGTGGHLYPAIAVAEKIKYLDSNVKIFFICSQRPIDSNILKNTPFEFIKLPAAPFSMNPGKLLRCLSSLLKGKNVARRILADSKNPTIIATGGFVAVPACWAAKSLNVPIDIINVDITPGKANKLLASIANEIYVQFNQTVATFRKNSNKVTVTGCPLRDKFENLDPKRAVSDLDLDPNKYILLITGASSGSQSINNTVTSLLPLMSPYEKNWQIVHIAGRANLQQVKAKYAETPVEHKIIDYYHDMPNLLAAADLLIGRSGAVSVAEYAAAAVPSICVPYPHHKDRHQYLNAEQLVNIGAAVVVDDLPNPAERAEWLWEELQPLLNDQNLRRQMSLACAKLQKKDAALNIAKKILTDPHHC